MELLPPLSAGSISLRLYPHDELDAPGIVDELRTQARAAESAGFDGVMTSEHHGGFAGYLPNPIQAAGWALEATEAAWAAPCPLLLPLRPTALVAEEMAWSAARFPGRVGLGVAAGSRIEDFELLGSDKAELTARFDTALAVLARALGAADASGAGSGDDLVERLQGDPAVARCRRHPVPLVSAAMSRTAARRAAAHGAGLLFDSLSGTDRVLALVEDHREAGGDQPAVLIRRVWVGPPPTEQLERQVTRYRGYAEAGAQAHWRSDALLAGPDAASVADQLRAAATEAGTDALNLRVHAPGVPPAAVRDQIERLGDVVALLRG